MRRNALLALRVTTVHVLMMKTLYRVSWEHMRWKVLLIVPCAHRVMRARIQTQILLTYVPTELTLWENSRDALTAPRDITVQP